VLFADRADAGRSLARELAFLRGSDVVVLGLPRGGVPVAFEVARVLDAPLDVIMVAMGAIGEGGIRIINHEVVHGSLIGPDEIAAVEQRERQELERQARRFRAGRPRVDITGRTAVLVDDGVATGSTARAACEVARAQGAARVMFAAPVGAPRSAQVLVDRPSCDEVILLRAPGSFRSVGQWYADFTPVPDAEVTALLQGTARSA